MDDLIIARQGLNTGMVIEKMASSKASSSPETL